MRRISRIFSILIMIVLVSSSLLVFEVKALGAPLSSWSNTYDAGGMDVARSVVQTIDGGYALAGTSFPSGGNKNAWLVKTDSAGNEEWNQTYGGAYDDVVNSMVKTSDGGYALAGYSYSASNATADFWLVKTNSTGGLQWSQRYSDLTYGDYDEFANSVVQTSDGGYALAGSFDYENGTAALLFKINSTGGVEWNRSFYRTLTDEFFSVVQTSDGGYALAGWTNATVLLLNPDAWLVKTNSTGFGEWTQIYGAGIDQASSLVQTSDGGYALAGTTTSPIPGGDLDGWLIKTNSNGNMEWNKTYAGSTSGPHYNYSTYNDQMHSVIQTNDGGYILAGETDVRTSGYNPQNAWLIKTDSAGNAQWNQTFGQEKPINSTEIAYSVIQTSDNGYALAGHSNFDFYLVKTTAELVSLTMHTAGQGTVLPGNNGIYGPYTSGSIIGLQAIAALGWEFSGWLGDASGSSNTTITMNGDKVVYALFNKVLGVDFNPLYGIFNDANEAAYSVVQTDDGGYLVTGTSINTTNYYFTWLNKYNSTGSLDWNLNFSGRVKSMIKNTDGNYTLAGGLGTNSWLLKVRPNGNVLLNKTYPGIVNGSSYARSIIETTDGGYAIAGQGYSISFSNSSMLLIKADASGNLQWGQIYSGGGNESAYSVVQTLDGGFVLAGYNMTAEGLNVTDLKAWLVKTNSAGNTVWNKTYGASGSLGYATSIVTSDSATCVFAGMIESSVNSPLAPWLVKISSEGNVLWSKTYLEDFGGAAFSLAKTIDDGYVLAGSAGPGLSLILKTNVAGDESWFRTHGDLNGSYSTTALSIIQTADGGYAMSGGTNTTAPGGDSAILTNGDAFLVKYAPESFSLTMRTIGQGTVTPGNGTFSAGANVSITAIAASGWTFQGWNGAATGLFNSSIFMTGDKAVTATFTKDSPSRLPQANWSRIYGGNSSERAESMVQTSDGGYALAGWSGNDFWLVRTDASGNEMWNKTYGGPGVDQAYSVVQTSDGGYALAGDTNFAGYADFWLVKVDASGTMLWNKTYGEGNTDSARSVVQTGDGGYALAGSTSVAGNWAAWLVRTDASGNMLWNKTYGGTIGDQAYSVVQTSDGGYALAGTSASFGVGGDFWLVRTDASGNMLWNKTYGGSSYDYANSVVQTSDGGYALTGVTASFGVGIENFWLVKVDASGNEMWNQTYGGGATGYAEAYSVVQVSDGGYALAGYINPYDAGSEYFWLVKVDASGNAMWNQTYWGVSPADEAYSMVQTSDGGYALAGYTDLYGAGHGDFFLVKTAPELLEYSVGLTVQNTAMGAPPGTWWNYIVVDTSSWSIVKNFTLPANGNITFADPLFAVGGTFYVTQVPKSSYSTIIEAAPYDQNSSAYAYNSTTASVSLSEFGGAYVTFNNAPAGLTIQNIVTNIPPELDWNYLITDLNSTIVYKNFTLPASGGSVTFTDAVFMNGGQFLVTATSKYGYSPDVTAVCSNGTAFIVNELQVLLTTGVGASTVVTFTNDEAGAFAFASLGEPTPVDWFYNIPPRQPVPVQAACPISIDGDSAVDLVLGKPMTILVNLTGLPQANGQISVSFNGGPISTMQVSVDDIINKRVISFPTMVPNTAIKNKQVTGTYTLGTQTGSLTPTPVTVKATNDLRLYFVWLDNPAYGHVDEQTFMNNVRNITAFINATYPVKNVTVYASYNGKSVTGVSGPFSTLAKGKAAIETDCTAVRDACSKYGLAKNIYTIGIGICPNNTALGKPDYFSHKGTATQNYSGAVGFSKGAGTKGVVVLDGYYGGGAHEVGHTFKLYYGIPEQYSGQYKATGGMPSNGIWAQQQQWRTGISFMGLIEKGSVDTTWEDNIYTYYWLFKNLTVTANDPEIIQTNGLIHQNGTVEITSDWYRTMGTADLIDPGNYSLRFADAENNTLSEVDFDAEFFCNIDGGFSVGQDIIEDPRFGTQESETASFAFAVEYPPETAKIEILNNTDPTQPPPIIETIEAEDVINLQGTKAYFTDSDFNPIESFDCIFTPIRTNVYKMTNTNPSTIYYNLQIKNNDPTGPFTVTIKIPSDFELKPLSPRAKPVQIDGKPVTYSISTDGVLTVSNIEIEQNELATLSLHLEYKLKGASTQYPPNAQTSFAKQYEFNATINSTQTITANVNAVGKKVTAIGGLIRDLLREPKGGLTITITTKSGSVVGTVISPNDGFYFMTVAPGTYNIKIRNSLGTLLTQAKNIKVTQDGFVEQNFLLLLSTIDASISGFVKDSNGNAIPGVTVKLFRSGVFGDDDAVLATTTTNIGGYYSFRFYLPGQYTVKITVPPGYTTDVTSKTVWINVAESETVNFNLIPTGP